MTDDALDPPPARAGEHGEKRKKNHCPQSIRRISRLFGWLLAAVRFDQMLLATVSRQRAHRRVGGWNPVSHPMLLPTRLRPFRARGTHSVMIGRHALPPSYLCACGKSFGATSDEILSKRKTAQNCRNRRQGMPRQRAGSPPSAMSTPADWP